MKLLKLALLIGLCLNAHSVYADDVVGSESVPAPTDLTQAQAPVQAEVFASPTAAPVPVVEVSLDSAAQREQKLVYTAGVVISHMLGDKATPQYMLNLEAKLNSLFAMARAHKLPVPNGISFGFDADAGFGIGGDAGTEFLFLMQEDGTVGFGVFPFVDIEAGAGAILSRGVFVDLVFNLKKVDDYKGYAIGIEGDIGFIKNGGAEFAFGVDGEDLKKLKSARQKLQLSGKQSVDSALEDLKELVTTDRSYVLGMGLSFGAGGKIMAYGGYWLKAYDTVIPFDEKAIRDELTKARTELKSRRKIAIAAFKNGVESSVKNSFEKARENRQKYTFKERVTGSFKHM